ncbi:MAG: hypothetical protein MZV63_71230 [Marinilabiliales bacterium]|nr:hypothetical protein [Marinilabiliales bacterium]
MLTLLFIILLFRQSAQKQAKKLGETKRLGERPLFQSLTRCRWGLLSMTPAREIIRANRQAATLFSYENEREMTGKLVPDLSRNEYEGDLVRPVGTGQGNKAPRNRW